MFIYDVRKVFKNITERDQLTVTMTTSCYLDFCHDVTHLLHTRVNYCSRTL